MRQQIAAGNWKMNNTLEEAKTLASEIIANGSPSDVITIMSVPALYLNEVNKMIGNTPNIFVAAQNCHQELKGAYTGELSVGMLKSIGVKYVILGHSERREYYGETDEVLLEKLQTVIENDMLPIYCCGEPLEIRKANTHVEYVLAQMTDSVFKLSKEQAAKIVIAYEPIWAIGTGETASPTQAQEMHAAIREGLFNVFGAEVANVIPILYGGSVKPGNAKEIFSNKDVDGGLVGGASLKSADFTQIMAAF